MIPATPREPTAPDRESSQRPRSRGRAADVDDCGLPDSGVTPVLQSLVRTVEGEVVPRLLLARRNAIRVPASGPGIEAGDANELARLLLHHETDVPFAYVESVRYRGVAINDIYSCLLAPAARRLGEMWEQDECDFMQVTVGIGRLHQVLHRVSQLVPGPERLDSRGHGRRVLLATVPGETHSFGVVMVSQYFRQNGWEVWNEFPATDRDLAGYVSKHSFALVGLSVGNQAGLSALDSTIRAIRRASLNRSVGIMVGGPLIRLNPELALRAGADATAEDGEAAAQRGESVCALLAGET
jgi:methanogenic corrinoid protein MtbC1